MIIALSRMKLHEFVELPHQERNCLGVIVQLEGNDPFELFRRIMNDVRKVPVERQQDGTKLLGLFYDDVVRGTDWEKVRQNFGIVPVGDQVVVDGHRDTLVQKKTETHAATGASNSARSRA